LTHRGNRVIEHSFFEVDVQAELLLLDFEVADEIWVVFKVGLFL
jgi:hypothetical protein